MSVRPPHRASSAPGGPSLSRRAIHPGAQRDGRTARSGASGSCRELYEYVRARRIVADRARAASFARGSSGGLPALSRRPSPEPLNAAMQARFTLATQRGPRGLALAFVPDRMSYEEGPGKDAAGARVRSRPRAEGALLHSCWREITLPQREAATFGGCGSPRLPSPRWAPINTAALPQERDENFMTAFPAKSRTRCGTREAVESPSIDRVRRASAASSHRRRCGAGRHQVRRASNAPA